MNEKKGKYVKRFAVCGIISAACFFSGCVNPFSGIFGGESAQSEGGAAGTTAGTRQDIEDVNEVKNWVSDFEEGFASNGFIAPEEVGEAVEEVAYYADMLKDTGVIEDYAYTESSVWMELESGIQMVYTPRTGVTDSIGLEDSCSIVTCQPYADEYPDSLKDEMGFPDAAAAKLDQASEQWTIKSAYDNEFVTLDFLKSLSGTQIILWHGHGGWTEENDSFLATGEEFSDDKYLHDAQYYEDFQEGRLLLSTDGRVCITSEFVDEYVGDMSGSLIYLGACQSGYTTELADAFIDKGAASVVVNSDTIMTAYNTRCMYSTMEGLLMRDSSTGQFDTLEQALDYAEAMWGADDSVYYSGIGAYPYYIGENFAFAGTESAPEVSPEPEAETPEEDIEQAYYMLLGYADGLDYISGTFSGYFEHTDDESRYVLYNYWSDLYPAYLGYTIADLDMDGTDELLAINVDSDYCIQPEVYEFVNGEVQLASSESTNAAAASPWEDGYVECMLYQTPEGGVGIGFEERYTASHLADGQNISFTALVYDGEDLYTRGSYGISGSSIDPDMESDIEDSFAEFGVYIDAHEVFYDGRSIYSFLDGQETFAGSRTYCILDDDEWLDEYQDWINDRDAERVEVSIIEFY